MRLRLIPKIVKQTLFICGVLWMHRASCIMPSKKSNQPASASVNAGVEVDQG